MPVLSLEEFARAVDRMQPEERERILRSMGPVLADHVQLVLTLALRLNGESPLRARTRAAELLRTTFPWTQRARAGSTTGTTSGA